MRTIDDMTEDERELYFAERRDARKRRGFSVDEYDPRIVEAAVRVAEASNRSIAESVDLICDFIEFFDVVDSDGNLIGGGGE